MTELLDNYIHQLRFRINSDAPSHYLDLFKKLKYEIECKNNEYISFITKEKFKLEINENIPILRRIERGFDDNEQICYQLFEKNIYDNDIIIYIQNSNIEKWSYEELDDIVLSFIKLCNNYMNTQCVNGCIELINYNHLNNDYLYNNDKDC